MWVCLCWRSRAMRFEFSPHKGCGISSLIPHCSAAALSLLHLMLTYDPEERISARAALQHPCFRDLRYEHGPEPLKHLKEHYTFFLEIGLFYISPRVLPCLNPFRRCPGLKVVPRYIITSYLAGDYFQVISLRLLHCKAPWLLRRNESIVPSHISLENHNSSFSVSLSTRCNYRRVTL